MRASYNLCMKIQTLALVATFALLVACSSAQVVPALPTLQSVDTGSPCGNSVCEGPETAINCPADCSSNSVADSAPSSEAPATGNGAVTPVLYFGLMVHLEGWDDHLDEGAFNRHAQLVRDYAELFERYDAVLTLESREMTDGSLRWGDNILQEMQARGHGVGVHADLGGQRSYDCSAFAGNLRAEKEQLESLGVSVIHVSGTVSHCDWVTASLEAGFAFTSGNVAYGLMSLPVEDRPSEFRNCPSPAQCHDPYPEALAERLTPYRADDGLTWTTPIAEGGLVIVPSSGGLACFAENAAVAASRTGCEFTREDIELAIAELDEALALVEAGRVNTYYLSWSLGAALDPVLLEEWLAALQPYAEAGLIEWASLVEMYELYNANSAP
jgi:hypothetical protein